MSFSSIVGIDEVGRGALAGPVLVAAASIPAKFRGTEDLGELRDSKRLSAVQRERWFDYFKNNPAVFFAVARVLPRRIERMNIAAAANLAAHRAFTRLCEKQGLGPDKCRVYLDGGLFLKSRKLQPKNARTVVGGDDAIPAVQAASIVAKVARDRYMRRLSKRLPQYGFEAHKGYGTKAHIAALKQRGPSPAHRLTFIRFLRPAPQDSKNLISRRRLSGY